MRPTLTEDLLDIVDHLKMILDNPSKPLMTFYTASQFQIVIDMLHGAVGRNEQEIRNRA